MPIRDDPRITLKPSSSRSDLEKWDADDQEKICNSIWKLNELLIRIRGTDIFLREKPSSLVHCSRYSFDIQRLIYVLIYKYYCTTFFQFRGIYFWDTARRKGEKVATKSRWIHEEERSKKVTDDCQERTRENEREREKREKGERIPREGTVITIRQTSDLLDRFRETS